MAQIDKIEEIIGPSLAEADFGIVRMVFHGGRGSLTLQILIERLSGNPVSVADCVSANRMISMLLDVEDPIDEAYTLEVSSAGIERPLVKLIDFERFKGRKAKIELKEAYSGRKKFNGLLKGLDGENVLLEGNDISGEEKELFSFPHQDIQRANLVFEMFMEKIGKAK